MRAVAETPISERYAAELWTHTEREQFINFITENPQAGDLLIVYKNAKFDTVPTSLLVDLKHGVEDAL